MSIAAGSAVPLNYGYVWATGIKLQSRTLQNTGNHYLDWTRIGFYLLGEGEMDGLVEMYDTGTGRLLAQNENDLATAIPYSGWLGSVIEELIGDPAWLHFHPGCDSVAGSGTAATSNGGDQGVDSFWKYLPSGLMPLHYNRWAYYAFMNKQVAPNVSNPDQENPDHWVDTQPIGCWRGVRCRIFDSSGAMVGYGFTRNPAWHYVDLLCRRKLFRESLIDNVSGAQDLPAEVKACFDFGALAESAAAFGELDAFGNPLFGGDYSFTQRTTLQACITQILTCSRSFQREVAGKYSITLDAPRASSYRLTRQNSTLKPTSDSSLHSNSSLYTGKFRDLFVPAFATISSIVMSGQSPVVTTEGPHSASADDYIVIGNTGTAFDTYWQVDSVPDTGGAPVYQMTLKSRGSNYPAAIGAGGLIGFRFSRFKDRQPQFQHKAFQEALGAVGIGIARQRNRRNKDTDFASCTWDQVARITKYQRGIELGADVVPYVSPSTLSVELPAFAPDADGTGKVGFDIKNADVVTIDSSLADAYKGLYEVTKLDLTLTGSETGGQTPAGPLVELTMRPYSADNYPSENQGNEPGWPTVPVMPGDQPDYTEIPLASGSAVFFAGQAASGDSFQLPDGYAQENMLCWGAPAGFVEGNAHLHFIQDCDAYATRMLQLIYNDSAGATWNGDLNYCGIAWRTNTSARTFTVGVMSYVELTLAGGEKIIFGKGIVNSESQVPTPGTYDVNKIVGMGFPKSASDSGKPTHGFASWIGADGKLHHKYQWVDPWEGPGVAMIFGALNNLGTWRKHANGWMHCPLPDGRILAINGISIHDHIPNAVLGIGCLTQYMGSNIPQLDGVTSKTLRSMTTPDGFDYNSDHPAHGVEDCHIDRSTLKPYCLWEDGEGNQWGGSNAVFSLLCDTPTAPVGGDPIAADPTRWPG